MDQVDLLEKESSLYGPGTFGGWLFTLSCWAPEEPLPQQFSVLATWTADPRKSKKDTITNDLLVTLTLPTIASSHLFYQLGQFPGSIEELLTSQDDADLQLSAAVEAPLNVCETFSAFAIEMVGISFWFSHRNRATSVLVVGVLCFSMQIVLHIGARNAAPPAVTFARPFVFHFFGAMVAILIIADILMAAFLASLLARLASASGSADEELVQRYVERKRREAFLVYSTFLFAAASIIISGVNASGVIVETLYTMHSNLASRMLFFVPKTPASINDLTLVMMWRADNEFRSCKYKESKSNKGDCICLASVG
ncbi:hypothetical protein K458DRAFT_391414 [Lentithecium fluviatile CBS 122367]|uniref:Uncharacterized protein n=1 Tax=Lentithecium fluviatile CBS 122367 TaxID=1168545 RepID=A0A6G1IVB6_9PLEO|nr:hypothetical protein K458DRAFT_391414 [Lentithecium fluviatile CBS 122367]